MFRLVFGTHSRHNPRRDCARPTAHGAVSVPLRYLIRSSADPRQMLTQGEIDSGKDSVARFVTLKVYEKAGGTLRRDLFSDNDKTAYLLDAPLLERLAFDKLQQTAKQIAVEGRKWIEVRARYDFEEFSKHGELRKARRTPDPQEDRQPGTLQRL